MISVKGAPQRQKGQFSILLVFVLWLAASVACAASDPLFWRVSQNQSGTSEVYLLGSIHYGHPNLYPLPFSVMEAFGQADALAVELDIASVDAAAVAQLVKRYGVLADGEDLRHLLGEQDWRALKVVCESLSLQVDSLRHNKPWLAAVRLVSMQLRGTGYRESLGVDRYFLHLAREGKQVLEVESLAEQFSMFSQLSDQEQLLLLRQTLAGFGQGKAYLDELAGAWGRADEAALESLVLDAFKAGSNAERVFDVVFTQRNRRMADAVEAMLKTSQSVFMVVGVGHMLGEQGLVSDLAARGYRLEQLNAPVQALHTEKNH